MHGFKTFQQKFEVKPGLRGDGGRFVDNKCDQPRLLGLIMFGR